MYGRNTEKDMNIKDFTIINEYEIIVTYENGVSKKLEIYNHNEKDKIILCNDFSTIIEY